MGGVSNIAQELLSNEERREAGAHYTTEVNILKVLNPLFLDELREEFEDVKHSTEELAPFQKKLASLTFLDPACGCGNFLVTAYRELRLLELEVLKCLYSREEASLDISTVTLVNVAQFYGIEKDEFPTKLAQGAMRLAERQMNMLIGEEYGTVLHRLPLVKTAKIVQANALTMDWGDLVEKEDLSYIVGNPPFIGYRFRSEEQKEDVARVFKGQKKIGQIDYVACWYRLAAKYIQGTQIKVGLVSTNSVIQGTHLEGLWNSLLNDLNIKIHFAHRSFKWSSEAKGQAQVTVVIIGFACFDIAKKLLYNEDGSFLVAKNISPYLKDASDAIVKKKKTQISNELEMRQGTMPLDGGGLVFTLQEKDEFLEKYPENKKFFREYESAQTMINGETRYILWLDNASPAELDNNGIKERVEIVKNFRVNSARKGTKEKTEISPLVARNQHPSDDYLALPVVSSENRKYIPLRFFKEEVVIASTCQYIASATLYHFGILHSKLHNAWVRFLCGKMKTDIRYSSGLCYNTFVFPEATDVQKQGIEALSQSILDIRARYTDSTLSQMYSENMPKDLLDAHKKLDLAVEKLYTKTKLKDDEARVSLMLDLLAKELEKKGKNCG